MSTNANDEWIKSLTADMQKLIYEEAYDLMAYRKAYYGENLTVDQAITKIIEITEET